MPINVIILILSLALMSGFIAFLGDRLGTIVGKKRLSLFGARPKRTGQIIGVIAGIAIMLLTLGVLALSFRGAVATIYRSQEIAAENRKLLAERSELKKQVEEERKNVIKARDDVIEAQANLAKAQGSFDIVQADFEKAKNERDNLEQQVAEIQGEKDKLLKAKNKLDIAIAELEKKEADLENQIAELGKLNEQLNAVNEALLKEKKDLSEQNAHFESLNQSLQAQVEGLNDELNGMTKQIESLRAERDAKANDLIKAQNQLRSLSDTGSTFRQNEIVFSGLIESQNNADIRAELSNFVRQANEKSIERGGGVVLLNSEQVDALVADISSTKNSDIVTLRAKKDQFGTSDIEVVVESRENGLIMNNGRMLLSKRIYVENKLGNESRLRTDIAELIGEANRKLVLLGLSSNQHAEIENLEDFNSQLERLDGWVTVGLVAVGDIYASGPAKLANVIIY